MTGMILQPATARQPQPDPKPFRPLFPGDFPPGSIDDPVYLPVDQQRYKLFRYGVRYFKKHKNWHAGRGKDMVLAWTYRHAREWGLTLPRGRIEQQAEYTFRILEKNRADGSTEKGLRRFQSAAGVKSGIARRAKNAERDADILRYVQDGGTLSAAARKFDLSRTMIRKILQRDRFKVEPYPITFVEPYLVSGPKEEQGKEEQGIQVEERERDYAGACGVALNDVETGLGVERTPFAGGQMIFDFDLNFSRCGQ